MKILLFGKNGQVGWELNRSLQPLGELIALGRDDADFSNPENLRKIVSDVNPQVIVNAVAYTAVDKAEGEEDLAARVNGIAPGVLAEESRKINALLVHYSTDYVFDGSLARPYTEIDKPDPINAYGRTKLAGEQAIQSSGCKYLIFRTSWVYASRGRNFFLTILKLAKERKELSVVSDQVGSPTPARLIAEATSQCLGVAVNQIRASSFSSGIYHLTSSGCTSWYDFAKELVDSVSQDERSSFLLKTLNAIPATEYSSQARRPMNSQLNHTKIEKEFGLVMPEWKKVLKLCVEELK